MFKPKPGQIDYTNIRRAPIINCVVQHGDKILIVQRSEKVNFYPSYWNGISAFLDVPNQSLEEKIKEELTEEVGIEEEDIISIHQGKVYEEDDLRYNKTWIVHPVLVEVTADKIRLDWEARNYKWVTLDEVKSFNLLPGFGKVLRALFG